MNDQIVDPTIQSTPEITEPLDRGEASENIQEKNTNQESQPDPEIISPPSAETMRRWKVFAEKIVSCGIISTQEYEDFSSSTLQNENEETINNKERRKQIEEIEQASKDPDLSVEEKAELKTKLKKLQVDQAYSDFLFMKQNIHRLSASLEEQQGTATTATEKMAVEIQRKNVLLELSTLFTFYGLYMDISPLINDFITDNPELNQQYIVNLNLALYTELGRIKDDMSTNSEAQSEILDNLALQTTYVSPQSIEKKIEQADQRIAALKSQIGQEQLTPVPSISSAGPISETPATSPVEEAVPVTVEQPPTSQETTAPQSPNPEATPATPNQEATTTAEVPSQPVDATLEEEVNEAV